VVEESACEDGSREYRSGNAGERRECRVNSAVVRLEWKQRVNLGVASPASDLSHAMTPARLPLCRPAPDPPIGELDLLDFFWAAAAHACYPGLYFQRSNWLARQRKLENDLMPSALSQPRLLVPRLSVCGEGST
jgi:hypothetical protein